MSELQQEIYPAALASLSTGWMTSLILDIALDLDVFVKLQGQSVSLEDLGNLWQMPNNSARALAQYLSNVRLLLYREGKLCNSPMAEAHLTRDSLSREITFFLMRQFDSSGWLDQAKEKIKELLFNPEPIIWYRDFEKLKTESFSWWGYDLTWLHELRIRWGEELASQYHFTNHQLLLDIGGASGGWSIGVRKLYPKLHCIVFDIPAACKVIRQHIAEAEQSDFIKVVEGDFFSQDLPRGADVVLLANVLHDWLPDDNRKILRKVYSALRPGGVLLVREYFFEDDLSGDIFAAHYALTVIGTDTKSGWQPMYSEMEQLLEDEGFIKTERKQNLLISRKP